MRTIPAHQQVRFALAKPAGPASAKTVTKVRQSVEGVLAIVWVSVQHGDATVNFPGLMFSDLNRARIQAIPKSLDKVEPFLL